MAKNKGLVFLRYVVLFAIVGGIMYGIFHYTARSTPVVQEPTPPVIIAQPTRKNLSLSITVQGYVEARNTVAVLPLVSGTIEETNLKVGHTVEQGELLAQIEDTPYRQQSLKAQAAQ
ncbi:MAG: biotin/lipoyl-binding protein, partial [Sphaerochaetaceae bacterium]|nr:biotin/lipoyl-binding protein [Sphaerochaetaceae bacterium]